MKNVLIPLLLIALVLFSGCADTELIDRCVDASQQEGFFMGILQGFIAPVTFVISIFNDDVAMYAVNNSGWFYDLGFLIGIGGFSGGVLKGRRQKSRD